MTARDKTIILAGVFLVMGFLLAMELGPHISGPDAVDRRKVIALSAHTEQKAVTAGLNGLIARVDQYRSAIAEQHQLQQQLRTAKEALRQISSPHRAEYARQAQQQAGTPRLLAPDVIDGFIARKIEEIEARLAEKERVAQDLQVRIGEQREALLRRADRLVDLSAVLQGKNDMKDARAAPANSPDPAANTVPPAN